MRHKCIMCVFVLIARYRGLRVACFCCCCVCFFVVVFIKCLIHGYLVQEGEKMKMIDGRM